MDENMKPLDEGTVTIVLGPVRPQTGPNPPPLPRIHVYVGSREIRAPFHLSLEANLDNGQRRTKVGMSRLCGVENLDEQIQAEVDLLSTLGWVEIHQEPPVT